MRLASITAGGLGLLAMAGCLQPAAAQSTNADAGAQNLALVSSAIIQGDYHDRTIKKAFNFQLLKPQTVTCPTGGRPCRVEALAKISLNGPYSNDANIYYLCLQVDGKQADFVCGDAHLIDGRFIQKDVDLSFAEGLTPGTHTLSIGLSSNGTIFLHKVGIAYHLYK